MLSAEELLAKLQISDPQLLEKFNSQDPRVLLQLKAFALYVSSLSREVDIAGSEAFIKTRPSSIYADASNKGLLPTAKPHQHLLHIQNKGENRVTLSQGRLIEDNANGRIWRLMTSITLEGRSEGEVVVEQSEYRTFTYTVPITEMFHRFKIELTDDMYLASIRILDNALPPNQYVYKPHWLNVQAGERVFNILTDSQRRVFIEFGESSRAGLTANTGDKFTVEIWETEGEIDIMRLKDASLIDLNSSDEQRLICSFKSDGLVSTGVSPYSLDELSILTSYSSLYDGNAVFLGDFDFLVRKNFLQQTNFSSVWNENYQEKYYGVNLSDINHLHVAIKAKNTKEQKKIEERVAELIGQNDNLYAGRVHFHSVEEVEYELKITGRLASVHDLDSVQAQIKALLIEQYGRSTLNTHKWLVGGFNSQEITSLLKNKITAFQDHISDFSIQSPNRLYKPHQWIYMTEKSISINLERTAESMGASWF